MANQEATSLEPYAVARFLKRREELEQDISNKQAILNQRGRLVEQLLSAVPERARRIVDVNIVLTIVDQGGSAANLTKELIARFESMGEIHSIVAELIKAWKDVVDIRVLESGSSVRIEFLAARPEEEEVELEPAE